MAANFYSIPPQEILSAPEVDSTVYTTNSSDHTMANPDDYISVERLQALQQQRQNQMNVLNQAVGAPIIQGIVPQGFSPPAGGINLGLEGAGLAQEYSEKVWVPDKKEGKKKKVGVATAIAHFAEQKAAQIKSKLELDKLNLSTNKKIIEENQKKVKVIERNVINLEEKYNSMTQAKRSELVSKYRKIITLLKKSPDVEKFATDIDKRVLVTTKPLLVQKKGWLKPREIGKFQIRIDFSQAGADGVEILNLTQRYGEYDSPTINNTRPCWGNIGSDITNEFQSQDLHELVLDLIDYIRSPHDSAGYLGDGGNKHKGWEQFFKGAKKQPTDFSFFKYDQLEKSKNIKGIRMMTNGDWEVTRETARTIDNIQAYNGGLVAFDTGAASTTITPERFTHQLRTQGVTELEYRIMTQLEYFGFSNRAAYYFTGLIGEEPHQGEEIITRMELRLSGGQITLFIHFENQERVRVSQDDSTLLEQAVRVVRYFVNQRDIRPEIFEQLTRNGSYQAVLPPPAFTRLDHAQIRESILEGVRPL